MFTSQKFRVQSLNRRRWFVYHANGSALPSSPRFEGLMAGVKDREENPTAGMEGPREMQERIMTRNNSGFGALDSRAISAIVVTPRDVPIMLNYQSSWRIPGRESTHTHASTDKQEKQTQTTTSIPDRSFFFPRRRINNLEAASGKDRRKFCRIQLAENFLVFLPALLVPLPRLPRIGPRPPRG